MKALFLLLLVSFSLSSEAAKSFGEKIPTDQKALSISQVKSSMNANESKEVLISAVTDKVCKKKGCWMSMKDGDESIRIRFKNYAFFVPKDADNQRFLAIGKMIKKETSIADQKHYLEDANASKEEISAVTSPKIELEFIASGIKFLDYN